MELIILMFVTTLFVVMAMLIWSCLAMKINVHCS